MKKLSSLIAFIVLCSFNSLISLDGAQYKQDYDAALEAQKSGMYADAIQLYDSSLKQNPDFVDALNNRGFCYRQLATKHLAKAGEAYEKAAEIDPNHIETLEYQGEYFVMMGELWKVYDNYQTLRGLSDNEAKKLQSKLDPVLKQAQQVLKSYSP